VRFDRTDGNEPLPGGLDPVLRTTGRCFAKPEQF